MNLETQKTIVPKSAKDLFTLLELGYQLIITKVNTIEAIDPDTWDLIDVALDTNGQYDGWETVLVK